MKVEVEKRISAQDEYNLALHVSCPWPDCGAVVGQRCNDDLFPQYPHTDRLQKALRVVSNFAA